MIEQKLADEIVDRATTTSNAIIKNLRELCVVDELVETEIRVQVFLASMAFCLKKGEQVIEQHFDAEI